MIVVTLLGSAWGATAKFCFEIQTDYTDIGGDQAPTLLDLVAYASRGAREVGWPVVQTGYLDAQGCGTATVNGAQSWRGRIKSEADYKNVEFKSWRGSCHL